MTELESCCCQKLTKHVKIMVHLKFERISTFKVDIYGTLIFQQSSMICIGRHVEGHTLALQHSGQTTFSLCLVKRVIVMLRCAVNVGTYFQYFP